jgi:hypothetical protein
MNHLPLFKLFFLIILLKGNYLILKSDKKLVKKIIIIK